LFVGIDINVVKRGVMRDFGFEYERIVDFNCENIKLKLCFREDCGSTEENGQLTKVFMGIPLALMCTFFLNFRR
jgi:hypothetical protein